MIKHTEKLAPVAAAVTALTTIACCLPMGIAAAAATAGLSTVAAEYQPWLLGAAGVMLAIGLIQLRSAGRSCARRSYSSIIIYCISAFIVLTVTFFPHVIAEMMAGWRR
jgi:cytochrome bd-type quinol oxidase subunit 2